MNFVKEPVKGNLVVPAGALKMSHLDGLPLRLLALKHAVVVTSGEMEAMEMIQTAMSLRNYADEIIKTLMNICGKCGHCSGEETCPCEADCEGPDIVVPDWAREEADIPSDAKLICDVDEDSGEIRVFEADYEYDLSDVPAFVIEAFQKNGACLGELQEHLMMEDVVDD